jgi:predicted TIM-barrel fold metal-dependent hydrolase
MMKIIDAHAHYLPPAIAQNTTFYKEHWSDLERQLSVMDSFGIEKALLLYPTTDAHVKMGGWREVCRVYNDEIVSVIQKYPKRFIGAGILPVDNLSDMKAELARIRKLNLSAISLASSFDGRYLDDEMFFSVYEVAQEEQLPIHVHPQIMNPIGEERVKDSLLTPVLEYVFDVSMCVGKMMMNGIFLKFPDVNFIFAHYGGVLPFVKERFDNTYHMLRKRNFVKDLTKPPSEFFKNLYFDTSGSRSSAALLCALEVVDASHILFGSDFPANQAIRDSIAVVENSSLKPQEKTAILFENFRGLLKG